WVQANRKDNRNCPGRLFGCTGCRKSAGNDHVGSTPNQVGSERRQALNLATCPAVFDCDALAFDVTCFLQCLTKSTRHPPVTFGRCSVEKSDHRYRLRTRHHRPRSRHTTYKRDELASLHSITWSARESSIGGIS